MKILVSVAAERLSELEEWARLAQTGGIDALGIGDSPGFHETWISVTVALRATTRLRVGPVVTNFLTRHPRVTAAALRSLEELSPGRPFVGVGTGDSALAGAGLHPGGAELLRSGIGELRAGWPVASSQGVPPWRVLVAANGPKALRAGGAAADVVVSGIGISEEAVATAAALVRDGVDIGRPPEFWTVVRMAIDENRDAAIERLRPLLASGANHVFGVAAEREAVPADIRAQVDLLRSRYDYTHHGKRGANPNAELVDELGLRPYLAERFALAGPPAEVAAGLIGLANRGVDGVVIPAVGFDPARFLERLGSEVLPLLSIATAATG